jgi:serine/threonine protein phosphatase PrpC
MGTTVTAVQIKGDHLSFAHVGDSRAYLLRDDKLVQITSDHTWVNEQYELGLIGRAEMETHPYRNIITRALGAHNSVDVDHIDLSANDGDKVILCSDGLNGMISDEEIRAAMVESKSIDKMVERLIDDALAGGGGDNVTIVALEFSLS